MVSIRQKISNMKADFKERQEQKYHAKRAIRKKASAASLRSYEKATIKVEERKAEAKAQPLLTKVGKTFTAMKKASHKTKAYGKKRKAKRLNVQGLKAGNPYPVEKKEENDVYKVKKVEW